MRKWIKYGIPSLIIYTVLVGVFLFLTYQTHPKIVLKPVDENYEYTEDEVKAIQDVLEARMDALDLGGSKVSYQFEDDIPHFTIEVASGSNLSLNSLATITSSIGLLEFVDYAGLSPELLDIISEDGVCIITDNQIKLGLAEISEDGALTSQLCENPHVLADNQPFTTVADNAAIAEAVAVEGIFDEHHVSFVFSEQGSHIFEEHTTNNQGERMAIVLNGEVISAPTINAVLTTSGQITGDFTEDEIYALTVQLNSVLLTTPLEVVEVSKKGVKIPWQE